MISSPTKKNYLSLTYRCNSVSSMNAKSPEQDCTTFHLTNKTKQKFIVHLTCSPKSASIGEFSRFMKDKAVTDVICFCKPEYDQTIFQVNGINYHNLDFPDGSVPGSNILHAFDQIIDQAIKQNDPLTQTKKSTYDISVEKDNIIVINMHCQSGLGRAPTMLAYLLITRLDYENLDSVCYVRKYRSGAFNKKQLDWILNTKLKMRPKSSCNIM